MSNIDFDPIKRASEIEAARARQLTQDRLFVVLLGPSCAGKSTIISELGQGSHDPKFEYVSPFTTRAGRPEELDKHSVSEDEFDAMEDNGDFVVVNHIYGARYGTPLRGITDPLLDGSVPILDFPLSRIAALKRPEYDILNFYIYPQDFETWQQRVISSGRNVSDRLQSGMAELSALAVNEFCQDAVDVSIITSDGSPETSAEEILEVIEKVVN